MKNIIIGTVISAIVFTACNSGKSKSDVSQNTMANDTSTGKSQTKDTITVINEAKATVSIKEIVNNYLQLKNAFAKDNTTDAASSGTTLEAAFTNFDKSSLTADQKKTFENIADDAREHAEHIGKNGGNIEHQREHFEMLSKDMYDLVKAFGGGQVLYKDFCPMYNKGKGAFWISETKEIQNPYLGKKMPTCGVVKETMK